MLARSNLKLFRHAHALLHRHAAPASILRPVGGSFVRLSSTVPSKEAQQPKDKSEERIEQILSGKEEKDNAHSEQVKKNRALLWQYRKPLLLILVSMLTIDLWKWRNDRAARAEGTEEKENQKKPQKTRKWHYYSGVGGEMDNARIFSGNGHRALAQEICDYLGMKLSASTVGSFSDGEVSVQVSENVRGKDIFIVQPVCAPVNQNLMELLFMISCCRRASARSITAVIPYYGYARQDRKMASRVPISSADVAIMLETMGVDRVIAIDLHSGQIQGFFAPRVPVDNMQVGTIGAAFFAEKELKNPVVVAPDGSSVPAAKKFRETLITRGHPDTDLAMLVFEKRAQDSQGHLQWKEDELQVVDIVGNVKGADCILVEDIIDTAGTVCQAAAELKRNGASRVFAFATHGLFNLDAVKKIDQAPIDEVVVTNTVPLSQGALDSPKINQLTVAPLLAETMRRVYQNTSVSSVFELPPQLIAPVVPSPAPAAAVDPAKSPVPATLDTPVPSPSPSATTSASAPASKPAKEQGFFDKIFKN